MKHERKTVESMMMRNGEPVVDENGQMEIYALPRWYLQGIRGILKSGPTRVEFETGQSIEIDDITIPLEDMKYVG